MYNGLIKKMLGGMHMKLEFLGAAHEVTGSCHYLEFADKHVLVDCGMEQGPDLYVNQEIPVNASTIDYVFVTHAHIDHSGLLPMLYNHGFRGQIFTTTATHQLCEIMLKDSAHIQMFEAEWKNRKAKRAGRPEVVPLYDMNDAVGVLGHFVSCDYHSVINVCEGLKVRFVDAGHLLGSSSIEMWISENTAEIRATSFAAQSLPFKVCSSVNETLRPRTSCDASPASVRLLTWNQYSPEI